MGPNNIEVRNFLQNRIQHLTKLLSEPNIPVSIKEGLRDKIRVFREELNELEKEHEHEFYVTEFKSGDWIEAECLVCGLRKTNS